MSTPHGMKSFSRTLATGEKVLIYSDAARLLLQLRRLVPSEEDVLAPSFKVAVALTPAEAIAIASELLNVALSQLSRSLAPVSSTSDPLAVLNEDEHSAKRQKS